MSLTAISSLESERKNISSTRRTSCLESKNETFFGSGGQNEPNSQNSSLESARRKFFMNSTYIMSRKKESNDFGLRRTK